MRHGRHATGAEQHPTEGPGGVHRAVPGDARHEGDARQGLRSGVQGGRQNKEDGVTLLAEGVQTLAEYQARLAAQDTWGVLVVLQALDAAGKDGTIRHVMSGVNPQGVEVHSFKVPSAEELTTTTCGATRRACPPAARSGSSTARTTRRCWSCGFTPRTSTARSSRRTAKRGDIWKRRYREINDWERYLDRQRLPDREAVPQPVKGGAADRASSSGSTCPTTTGSSPTPTSGSASTGTTTRTRSPRCSRTRARSGRRGT